MSSPQGPAGVEPLPSVVTVANIVYALHTFAIVVGIVGSVSIIFSFVGSLPSIVAVILNYVKRGDARGTWAESHYRWQIRTFWFAVLWIVVAVALTVAVAGASVTTLNLFGFLGATLLWIPILGVLTLWLIYRIARGWLRLRDKRPMYV